MLQPTAGVRVLDDGTPTAKLVSLDEVKRALSIPTSINSYDSRLNDLIDSTSDLLCGPKSLKGRFFRQWSIEFTYDPSDPVAYTSQVATYTDAELLVNAGPLVVVSRVHRERENTVRQLIEANDEYSVKTRGTYGSIVVMNTELGFKPEAGDIFRIQATVGEPSVPARARSAARMWVVSEFQVPGALLLRGDGSGRTTDLAERILSTL